MRAKHIVGTGLFRSAEPPSLSRRDSSRRAELRYTPTRTSNEPESYSPARTVCCSPQRNSLPAVIPAAVAPRTKLFLCPTREPELSWDQETLITASRYRDSYCF